jgi:Xaa-Pro aminopeptidase
VTEASNRPIPVNWLFLVDSGGQYLDGTTDITRTIAVGKVSAEMKDRFTRVLKGHIASPPRASRAARRAARSMPSRGGRCGSRARL